MTLAVDAPEALAACITRHTTLPAAAWPTAVDLAGRLLALRGQIPAGDCLLLGGSLARGEPAIIPTGTGWTLASDLDLLLVHSTTLPRLSGGQLADQARDALPTVTVMTVSAAEYQRMHTCLGREFKDLGIVLTGHPPLHDPVTLDARDAFELLLYAVQSWFWDGLATAWRTSTDPAETHLKINRTCLRALRASVLLAGGDRHSDLDAVAEPLRDRLRAELAWRADPNTTPLDPGRWWPLVADVLAVFDQRAAFAVDAVTGTRYEHRPGAAAVAEQQRLAHALARMIPTRLPAGRLDAETVAAAQHAAWHDAVERGAARPNHGPEEHFGQRVGAIRADMLRLKTAPDPPPTPLWPWDHRR